MNKVEKFRALCEGKRVRVLTGYIKSGNVSSPVSNASIIENLTPGFYQPQLDMDGLKFVTLEIKTDSLLKFEDARMMEIRKEVETFWTLKDDFSEMGFVHNRGIGLYGDPGTGKSCLLKILIGEMISNGEIVFNCRNINSLLQGLRVFREVEPDRKLLVVMEDLDTLVRYDEHELLELLDGDNQVDNVLYVATTNYIDRIPERVRRPGRFDRCIEIPMPPYEGRLAYLKMKLDGVEDDSKIKKIAEQTKGMSFGHLREYVISVYCLKYSPSTVINRLRNTREDAKVLSESMDRLLGD